MEQNEILEMLRSGIEAARNNNHIIARDYFRRVLEIDGENELAWLWMARTADRRSEQRQALQRVLQINPNNEKARAALQQIADSEQDVFDVPGASPSITSSRQAESEGVEQERDWFQPVQRPKRDTDLWRGKTNNDIGLLYLLGAAIAVAIIGIATFLLIDFVESQDEDNQTATANAQLTQAAVDVIAQQPTVVLTPSNTPRPTSPLLLTPRDRDLPPTLAPTITNTPLPSQTPTPVPPGPESFSLVVSSNENPGAPARLYTLQGDGVGFELLDIDISQFANESAPPADTSDETATDEPPAEPTEETEAATEEAPPADDNAAPFIIFQGQRAEILDPALSPTGEFVAFTLQIGEVQEIFVVNADGDADLFQLTLLGASETRGATWSPDSDTILFHSNLDGDFDIYGVTFGGGDVANITNNDANDIEPSFAPDGQWFAFASDRDGGDTFEIYVHPFGGQAAATSDFAAASDSICQMTNAQNSSFSPAWSPDGQFIAFISNRDRDNDLYVMRFDGSNEQLVSFGDGSLWQERNPAWSPDSRWIAVSSNRLDDAFNTNSVNPTSKIWIASTNGQDWRRITDGESNELSASWAPRTDGVQIDISDFEFRCAAG